MSILFTMFRASSKVLGGMGVVGLGIVVTAVGGAAAMVADIDIGVGFGVENRCRTCEIRGRDGACGSE